MTPHGRIRWSFAMDWRKQVWAMAIRHQRCRRSGERLIRSLGEDGLEDLNHSNFILILNYRTIDSRSDSILRVILSHRTVTLAIVPKKERQIGKVDHVRLIVWVEAILESFSAYLNVVLVFHGYNIQNIELYPI
jgi:hypothetical protein